MKKFLKQYWFILSMLIAIVAAAPLEQFGREQPVWTVGNRFHQYDVLRCGAHGVLFHCLGHRQHEGDSPRWKNHGCYPCDVSGDGLRSQPW